MKVDLYLKNINQEMIDSYRGGRRRLGRAGDDSWVVSWPKSCCILDFSLTRPIDKVSKSPVSGFMLRGEGEGNGGMFWNPRSGSVYKVDDEAYHTMLELDSGLSELQVARRMNISKRKVTSLVTRLRLIHSHG